MNNKKRIVYSVVSLLTGALVCTIYNYYTTKLLNKEECSTSLVVFYNNTRSEIKLNFIYSLENKKGIVAVSGNYYEQDKLQGKIRRDVEYRWSENHDTYQLVSTKINHYSILENLSLEKMAKILPGFYLFPERKVNYSIQNQGTSGFVFSAGERPLFYCAR
ncbi:TPA_asm: hypothetical protein GND82_001739 [Salmonella enterica subsp. salamae serovar 60:g,m,t:z6]|uniref:YqeJ protein n=1 Tax=Salmonella enterica subsp. houtenae serovar 1,40:z4,z32:- TaxID=1967604 RepID=A0A730ZRH3_SALHO|nr:hypothetical protein [Salmonella enterica]HAC6698090.1 hypothetical protein [Salmonella bongori serovar 66:z65:-]HAE2266890.1 hypothetical protein [Salmonella enterica subsp. enterica serovar 1,9,12:-:-]HAE4188906.1 hypothetical protein [Salmonella enterica subsp. houtenae serovar 1,40:z4,z32:-]HAE7512908.1 hypothetical protein [Salmonella enterica subsp. salamae serovar 60:g,m,t:z6]